MQILQSGPAPTTVPWTTLKTVSCIYESWLGNIRVQIISKKRQLAFYKWSIRHITYFFMDREIHILLYTVPWILFLHKIICWCILFGILCIIQTQSSALWRKSKVYIFYFYCTKPPSEVIQLVSACLYGLRKFSVLNFSGRLFQISIIRSENIVHTEHFTNFGTNIKLPIETSKESMTHRSSQKLHGKSGEAAEINSSGGTICWLDH